MDVELPVFFERHVKVAFKDSLGGIPIDGPLMIWCDPVCLPWSDAERELLAEEEANSYLLAPFPAGVHARPEGSTSGLILWTYDMEPVAPEFPFDWDSNLPEIVLRGLSAMLPKMAAYFGIDAKDRC